MLRVVDNKNKWFLVVGEMYSINDMENPNESTESYPIFSPIFEIAGGKEDASAIAAGILNSIVPTSEEFY